MTECLVETPHNSEWQLDELQTELTLAASLPESIDL